MVFGQHQRGERPDPFRARTRANGFEQKGAEAPSLPVVDHGNRDLRRVGTADMADVACEAEPRGALLVQRED